MNKKRGFTLIEVSLFLALSGLLIVGIIAGTNRSIARQRYNNAVETFADFLRGLYSQVEYAQNSDSGGGKSEKAIYGKLAVFGVDGNKDKVDVYTVVGNADCKANPTLHMSCDTTENALEAVSLSPYREESVAGTKVFQLVKKEEKTLNWFATAETTTEGGVFTGSILIVRSPISGSIYTLFSNNIPGTDDIVDESNNDYKIMNELPPFVNDDINFCINSEDKWAAGNFRKNIRINSGAYNSSSVEILYDNYGGNQCS